MVTATRGSVLAGISRLFQAGKQAQAGSQRAATPGRLPPPLLRDVATPPPLTARRAATPGTSSAAPRAAQGSPAAAQQAFVEQGFRPADARLLVGSGLSAADARALRELDYTARQIFHFGKSGGNLGEARAYAGAEPPLTPAQVTQFRRAGGTPDDLAGYRYEGFRVDEAICLERAGIGITGGKEYRRHGLPIDPVTTMRYKPDGAQRELGKGAFNTVFAGAFRASNGVLRTGVFKPLEAPVALRARQAAGERLRIGVVGAAIGVQRDNPKVAERNLVTAGVEALLQEIAARLTQQREDAGLSGAVTLPPVVPRTTVCLVGEPPRLGVLMDQAPGVTGHHQEWGNYSHPEVYRGLITLQCLDALVGQGDRHAGNYLIGRDAAGKPVVTGIDNDQSCGTNRSAGALSAEMRGAGDRRAAADRPGFYGCGLPGWIDTDMAAVIREIAPRDIERLFARIDGPDSEVVKAAVARLTELQTHVGVLETRGRVIPPSGWQPDAAGKDRMHDRLTRPGENNYVYRDMELAMQRLFDGNPGVRL